MTAQPYAGPAGVGQFGAPLQPPPPPAPVPVDVTPHPDESWQPGELGYYTYHDHRDPEGTDRTQLIMVTHVEENHVHGIVLGDTSNGAQFAPGVLTHEHPAG